MKEQWKVRRQVETKNKGSKTKFQRKSNSKQIIKRYNFISISMVHNDNNSHGPFNSLYRNISCVRKDVKSIQILDRNNNCGIL